MKEVYVNVKIYIYVGKKNHLFQGFKDKSHIYSIKEYGIYMEFK